LDIYIYFFFTFMVAWHRKVACMREFLKFINSFHETISYSWDYSENHVSFLDVTICKKVGGDISTDVYSKPTDTHQYLDFIGHVTRS
jgi:hypothetical protein